MALGSALKDRGRIVRKEADAKRVEGRTRFNPRALPWFRCRLTIEDARERSDDGGVMSVRRMPTLLVGARDTQRNLLAFQPDDEIEIESRELGNATFEVDGEPKPLRKKRRVIGWELRLARVTESDFEKGRA